MPTFQPDDIDEMLADMGVEITFNTTTLARGALVDTPDEVFFEQEGLAGLIGSVVRILIRTDSLPGLKIDSAITADGTNYTVRNLLRQGDGGVTELHCKKV